MNNIVYDLEIAELMLNEFKMIYAIEDNEELFKYFLCRFVCSCIDDFKNIKNDFKNILHCITYKHKIVDFVLNELDIICNDESFIYKDSLISKYSIEENSIMSILIELESICIDLFEKNQFYDNTLSLLNKIYSSAKRKSTTKKHSVHYKYYLIYYSLMKLNSVFGIDYIRDSNFFNNFNFVQALPSLKLEDLCCRYIDSISNEHNDALVIDENHLELYLYKNLEIIEEGLIPIQRQFIIKDGRIDILAKDKDGIYTIIELKVENDTDLIFQCVHYSTQLKKEKNLSKVRFISISPEYSYGILNSLKSLKSLYEIDSYICSIKVKGIKKRKIDSVKLLKVL